MSAASNEPEPIVAELNGLVALAEASTATIDQLLERQRRAQLKMLSCVLFVYVGVALVFVPITLDKLPILAFDSGLKLIIAGAGVLSLVAGSVLFLGAVRGKNLLSRELRTERRIHARLMSMIDDQFARVRRMTDLSPVALATIDIRLARLDRAERTEARSI